MKTIIILILILTLTNASLAQNTDMLQIINEAKQHASQDFGNQNFGWFLGGFGCGIFGVAAAYIHNPQPPVYRLLGKSPEYVTIYTSTYQNEQRNLRTKHAWGGCIIGTALSMLLYVSAPTTYY